MGLHKPDPLHGVEHVVANVPLNELPESRRTETRTARRGFAVQHSGSHRSGWLFFEAPEPAYVYGRSARMAHGCTDWAMHHASHIVQFDSELDRDVSTLYLSDKSDYRGPSKGDPLVEVWQQALTLENSNWTGPTL